MRGSRFIATAWPVSSVDEARGYIEGLRREYPDATHHCWAWRLTTEGGDLERAHDAREPVGTGGPPILMVIRGAALTNVLVAVTRYFGGTKLGKGGLARAYSEAARAVLQDAPKCRAEPYALLKIMGPMERDGEVRHLAARHGGKVCNAAYDDTGVVILKIRLPVASVGVFADDLDELTRGVWRIESRGRDSDSVSGPS